MEYLVLSLFAAALLACIALGFDTLWALVAGLVIFCFYAWKKGNSPARIWGMMLHGAKTSKNIIVVLLLIGTLTALWRASGAIPVVICYAAKLIRPRTLIIMTFLLNCGVSVLTGTSFGTAATMGVICMSMGAAMGADPVLMGGAILSGIFFGDRCSPVSTSALLVSEVTGTNIYDNISNMLRTGLVPLLICCAIYTLLGLFTAGEAPVSDLEALFGRELVLSPVALLPAAVILVLAAFRVKVKLAMAASIAAAAALCILLQKNTALELLSYALTGFVCEDAEVGAMLSGGGALSMVKVVLILAISSSCAGIFRETGLLDPLKTRLETLGKRITPFGSVLVTSAATSLIACNQTLPIILAGELCAGAEPDKTKLALALENSAVVVSALVPWSIAGGVPIATIGAPTSCLLAACFLYVLPLWYLCVQLASRRRAARSLQQGK